jgi:hypothetical protein
MFENRVAGPAVLPEQGNHLECFKNAENNAILASLELTFRTI